MQIDKIYNDTLKAELTKRLGRKPLANEMVNADNDSDLVNEVLWQLVCNLQNRIAALEVKNKITKPSTSMNADGT